MIADKSMLQGLDGIEGVTTVETLTAGILNAKYGSVIAPFGRVSVPFGWSAAVFEMMQSLHDLPSDVRAFLMIMGVYPDAKGLLCVDLMLVEDHVAEEGKACVRSIIQRAIDLCAWTCMLDGKPGWYRAIPGRGGEIRCARCQGLELEATPHVA